MQSGTANTGCIFLKKVWLDIDDGYDTADARQELFLTCDNQESIDYHTESLCPKNCAEGICSNFKAKE